MPSPAISVENLSKYYKLGLIGGGTLREDVSRWAAKLRGKPDPTIPVGTQDHHNRKGGEIWALRDINLEIKEGEILGIIGRNGTGKSTLLKILSRITAPTSGRAVIRGRVGSLLEVGTGFHPELTGRENIYLNGAILGMTKDEVTRKLEEIVEFAEMGQFIDTPVKRYSSGMTVRLAFAVAAHLEPEILIIDEVLAVGDAEFQKRCLGKMDEVASGGRTILFVSHQLNMITALCTKAVLMSSGQIVYEDDAISVVEEYLRNRQFPNDRQNLGVYSSSENRFLSKTWVQHAHRDGLLDNLFSFNEDVLVKVVYRRPKGRYFVAVTIDNTRGVRLFSHRDTDMGGHGDDCDKGDIVEATLLIPGRFLSPDYYSLYVDVDTLIHGRSDIHETAQIGFEIGEDGFDFIGGRALKKSRPIFWPRFQWENRKIDMNNNHGKT